MDSKSTKRCLKNQAGMYPPSSLTRQPWLLSRELNTHRRWHEGLVRLILPRLKSVFIVTVHHLLKPPQRVSAQNKSEGENAEARPPHVLLVGFCLEIWRLPNKLPGIGISVSGITPSKAPCVTERLEPSRRGLQPDFLQFQF